MAITTQYNISENVIKVVEDILSTPNLISVSIQIDVKENSVPIIYTQMKVAVGND